MKHTIYYTFDVDYKDAHLYASDYAYYVEDSLRDVVEYSYEKAFNEKFNEMSWFLTDGAKPLVEKLEKKYFENTLDFDKYYTFDWDFKDWIKEKYYDDALEECYKKMDKITICQDYCYFK